MSSTNEHPFIAGTPLQNSPAKTAGPPCPVCHNPQCEVILQSVTGYPIVRCSECALVYTDDRTAPPPSSLYPAFDQTEDSPYLNHVRSAVSVFLRQRAAVVRSMKPGGRLLDYGCGNGAFAKHMSETGFSAVGLEPFSLGSPQVRGNLRLVRGPLEEATDLGEFDAITLWHVLEHVPNPVDLLTRLAKHLRPDGVLFVSVPNFASWQSSVFRDSWFHLDAPRHLLHFEPDTLTDCLKRAGLSSVKEHRFLPEYGGSGWVQSALNKVLPHSNYLYEVVKDRGALKSLSVTSSLVHLVTSMVAGAPLFALSLPIEAAASMGNRGAALTVAARRQL